MKHLTSSYPSHPLHSFLSLPHVGRTAAAACRRGAASSGSTIFLESFFSRWPGQWAHAGAHCTHPRLCLLRPHRRGRGAEAAASPVRWWKATRRRGSSEAAKLRAESQGCAARGAAARGQRGRGAAVRGRARPANLQQGGPTLAGAAPGRALGRGAAELLRRATGGGAVMSSPGGKLCMPVFSLPPSLCRPHRARPSPPPPSLARFSWRVISRDTTFVLAGECGIQPGVAWVETPCPVRGVVRRLASGNGTTPSPDVATRGPSVGTQGGIFFSKSHTHSRGALYVPLKKFVPHRVGLK
jgi:hypothetical protein